VKCCNQ